MIQFTRYRQGCFPRSLPSLRMLDPRETPLARWRRKTWRRKGGGAAGGKEEKEVVVVVVLVEKKRGKRDPALA